MKKLFLLIAISLTIYQSALYAWEWESYGPPDIKANKLSFFDGNIIHAAICTDSGMFIVTDYSGMDYTFCSYAGMKVVEAVLAGFGLDSDSILVVMSDGSYSDGIYSFSSETGLFTNLEYCFYPNFILKATDCYFVGYEYGLLVSTDGLIWSDVPFFNGNSCIDMTTNFEHFVVATNENLNNTYHAFMDVNTWTPLTGTHISELSDCNFYNASHFYGINEGTSGDCGFYEFSVSESDWDNVFSSYYLNAVGTDNCGGLFVGWFEGITPNIGIARCYPELTYLNDGLPDLNIHAISAPANMGATVVYCCTDYGIYSRVLSVGEVENKSVDDLSIFPNPAFDHIYLSMNSIDCLSDNIEITILNNSGSKMPAVNHINMSHSTMELTWNRGDLPPGIYYMKVRTKRETLTEKFIIL